MTRKKSRIRHDYKITGQPAIDSPRKTPYSFKPGRWFVVGAIVPIVAVAVALFGFNAKDPTQPLTDDSVSASFNTATASLLDLDPQDGPLAVPATSQTELLRQAKTVAPLVLKLPEPKPDLFDQIPTGDDNYRFVELTIKSGDTLDELFKKNKLSRSDLGQILKIKEAREALTVLRPGDTVKIAHEEGRVIELRRELDEVRTLKIARSDEAAVGFATRIVEKPIELRMQHAKGTIDSSLFIAASEAGVSDTLIMNLAGIFAWDVDFVLDIRRGDSFTMVYEEIWQDGHFVRNGEILAAEFNNNGKSFRAVRYADPGGDTGYYTPEGLNVKKAFLRAPIAFTPRVTSNFNPKRFHPVKKTVRPHRGVDYGAPRGTPIKAAGDGKVIHRGRKNGYGNTVILQHGGNITTLYAHMSNYARKVKHGTRVKQGQVVGFVGRTGTATGNHLHYEYRLNGVHRNPRTVKLPQASPIPTKYKSDFVASTRQLINHLDAVSKVQRLALVD